MTTEAQRAQSHVEKDDIRFEIHPEITPEQLFSFYEKNNICEVGFGKEIASKVLKHSSLIVAAFCHDELIGIARAMFDGLSAAIMEFSVALRYQGENLEYENGSLIEKDTCGVGNEIGSIMKQELLNMGATFITIYIVEKCEETFYQSLDFKHNTGHLVYYIDKRPYVPGN